jgi:hypothetical protein
LKKRSLWISAAAAVAIAGALAGCGSTTYFGGRVLPPSKLVNRVVVAIQNPSALTKGELEILDAFYDNRRGYNGTPSSFSISGYGGALPVTIQNMPEEQFGAVYGSGDGSFTLVNYQTEKTTGSVSGLNGFSSSIFITRNAQYVFAANEASHVLTIVNQSNGSAVPLSLPGVYRVSVNPGGSVALAFVENSNYAYYPVALTTQESLAFSGGPSTWPQAAEDCEPQIAPIWCLLQAQSPDALDSHYNGQNGTPVFYTGAPLKFDRPVKAVFSADGGTAYVLSCGPECGGVASSVSLLPVAPLIFQLGKGSGLLPCNSAPCANSNTRPIVNIPVPGGASNALVDTQNSDQMYVIGQKPECINNNLLPPPCPNSESPLFGGNLTAVNLTSNTAGAPVAISDGQPGAISRMIEADDNTLWIGMSGCTTGVRYAINPTSGFGCLTMFNTSTNTVTLIEPYIGNATGIADVQGLHKIYTAEGGQVYIYSTTDGSSIDNYNVTVTGTAYDVAYIDATIDADNTVY